MVNLPRSANVAKELVVVGVCFAGAPSYPKITVLSALLINIAL